MQVIVCDTKEKIGQRAATEAALIIEQAICERGRANLILATGVSQFKMLATLLTVPDINWSKVTGFHLDEYVGLSESHPASFRKYLRERFVEHVPLREFHYINAQADAAAECARLGRIINDHPIDLACVGIGENGHLAFNDPPADFETQEPYIVVELDEVCRKQQVNEGWFDSFEDVPKLAISMSIRQIMKSRAIICCCPDQRKAKTVKDCLEGPVSNQVPASILQQHQHASIYLDSSSASLLECKLRIKQP